MQDIPIYLDPSNIQALLTAREGPLSLRCNLGLGSVVCRVYEDRVEFETGQSVCKDELESIKKAKKVFRVDSSGLHPIEVFSNHYYKLEPTDGAPTFQIDGIQMHRTKGVDPFIDAKEKVEQVVRQGDIVLDSCGGLGYNAIWSVRRGARLVISVELAKEVCYLRENNPWSREFFCDKIQAITGDVFEEVRGFQSGYFNSIIHDPPRFSLAGELYSREFYRELYRILKPRGRLFHYTGEPYSVRGKRNFYNETSKRLQEVGFSTKIVKGLLGIVAVKQ